MFVGRGVEKRDRILTLVGVFMLMCVSISLMSCVISRGTPDQQAGETLLRDGIATIVEENSDVAPAATVQDSRTTGTGPVRGGVFLYEGSNWILPDPAFPDVGGSIELHLEVFSGLMRIGTDGENIVEPELADRFSVLSDGLTYEFVLKRDLKFSDGSPLTAGDFKWSWERALSPRTDSPHARKTLGMIEGSDALISGRSNELAGVTVVDDRTLRVKLSNPRADFPLLLADPSSSVLKKSNVEKWRDEWSNWFPDEVDAYQATELPVGTGPFKIVDLNPEPYELSIVLRRNDHYYGRPAYLEGVVWVEFTDVSGQEYLDAQNNAFDRSEIDTIDVPWDIAESETERVPPSRNPPYFVEADTGSFFMVFNPSVAPFDDRHFRRALVAASNITAWEPSPGLDSADAISPPGMPYRSSDITSISFDRSRAQSEWEQSRYHGDALDIVYHTYITDFLEDEIGMFADSWRAAFGIKTRIEVIEFERWDSVVERGEIGMTSVGTSAANPDPHAIFGVFETLWGENNDAVEYQEVLLRLDTAASELDRAARIRTYQELEQHLLDEALAMPLLWFNDGYYVRTQPWVRDYKPSKWAVSRFKDVWFDNTAPKRELPLP